MDLENYISSGVLENYVLGLLSEKENREVLAMMESHLEVAKYVRSLEDSLETYGRLHAVPPPIELKSVIMEQIRAQKSARFDVENNQLLHSSQDKGLTLQKQNERLRFWRKLAIAGIIILMASLGGNIYFSIQKHQAQKIAEDLASQNKLLIMENKQVHQRLVKEIRKTDLLANPDIRPVVMNGVKQHPAFKVTVYWNSSDRTVYLGESDLPEIPADKIYQLWAIVDGKPVDLGIFSPGNKNLPLEMKKIGAGNVQAFAITLEKEGGNPTPTMDQMYVMGATS